MLRLGRAVARAAGLLADAERGFATQTPQDYGTLVMKKATELAQTEKPRDKEVGLLAGVPVNTFQRQARIYVSSKSASQSGYGKTAHISNHAPQWRIGFDSVGKWENPLIGWTSTADTLENVGRASLFFYTKEQAMDFCRKHGWSFVVDEPKRRSQLRQKRYAGYGDNFSIKRNGVPDLSHLPSEKK